MEAASMEAARERTAGGTEETFKSPVRLLVRFFRKSRQRWKQKALRRRAKMKNLEHKVRDIDTSRTNWKNKAEQLKIANQALEERLRVSQAERERLQGQLQEFASKKARRPVVQ
jgi:hypothetical protein